MTISTWKQVKQWAKIALPIITKLKNSNQKQKNMEQSILQFTDGLSEKTTADKENYSQMVEIKNVDKTPFQVVKKDNKWRLVFGNYALTGEHDTAKDAIAELDENSWGIVGTYVLSLVESYLKIKNEKE